MSCHDESSCYAVDHSSFPPPFYGDFSAQENSPLPPCCWPQSHPYAGAPSPPPRELENVCEIAQDTSLVIPGRGGGSPANQTFDVAAEGTYNVGADGTFNVDGPCGAMTNAQLCQAVALASPDFTGVPQSSPIEQVNLTQNLQDLHEEVQAISSLLGDDCEWQKMWIMEMGDSTFDKIVAAFIEESNPDPFGISEMIHELDRMKEMALGALEAKLESMRLMVTICMEKTRSSQSPSAVPALMPPPPQAPKPSRIPRPMGPGAAPVPQPPARQRAAPVPQTPTPARQRPRPQRATPARQRASPGPQSRGLSPANKPQPCSPCPSQSHAPGGWISPQNNISFSPPAEGAFNPFASPAASPANKPQPCAPCPSQSRAPGGWVSPQNNISFSPPAEGAFNPFASPPTAPANISKPCAPCPAQSRSPAGWVSPQNNRSFSPPGEGAYNPFGSPVQGQAGSPAQHPFGSPSPQGDQSGRRSSWGLHDEAQHRPMEELIYENYLPENKIDFSEHKSAQQPDWPHSLDLAKELEGLAMKEQKEKSKMDQFLKRFFEQRRNNIAQHRNQAQVARPGMQAGRGVQKRNGPRRNQCPAKQALHSKPWRP